MNIWIALSFIPVIIHVLLGTYVLAKRKQNPLNSLFFLYLLSLIIWCGSEAVHRWTGLVLHVQPLGPFCSHLLQTREIIKKQIDLSWIVWNRNRHIFSFFDHRFDIQTATHQKILRFHVIAGPLYLGLHSLLFCADFHCVVPLNRGNTKRNAIRKKTG